MSKSTAKCSTCGQPILGGCLAGSALDGLELHFDTASEAGFAALLELAPDPEALAALARVGSPRSYSAADAYEFRAGLVRMMLAAIEKGLEAHAGREAADSRNWGFAGDLGHVSGLLGQVMGALGVVEVA